MSVSAVWYRTVGIRYVLIAVAVVLAGCALPMRRICADGWPVKILQDPQCRRGICGYTCAPDRWRVPPTTDSHGIE